MSDQPIPALQDPAPTPTPEVPAEPSPPSDDDRRDPKWIAERLARHERAILDKLGLGEHDLATAREVIDAARTAAADLDERKKADMSELEKRDARILELEASIKQRDEEAAEAALDNLRAKVAADNGIPVAFAARLVGTTEEELVADAKSILSDIAAQGASPEPPAPAGDQKFSPEQLARLTPDEYAKARNEGKI